MHLLHLLEFFEVITAMVTATQLYEETIQHLPPGERLRLATLILEGIPPQSVMDCRELWSDEDLEDFSRGSWRRVEQQDEAANA